MLAGRVFAALISILSDDFCINVKWTIEEMK